MSESLPNNESAKDLELEEQLKGDWESEKLEDPKESAGTVLSKKREAFSKEYSPETHRLAALMQAIVNIPENFLDERAKMDIEEWKKEISEATDEEIKLAEDFVLESKKL